MGTSLLLRSLRASALMLVMLVMLTGGCSSSDAGDPAPAPDTLFGTLPAASAGKLRGVWETTQTQANGTIVIRLRFVDSQLVAAAKCTVEGGVAPVIAGTSTGIDANVDAPTGTITFGNLSMSKTENNVLCKVEVPGGTYDFAVDGATLTLRRGNQMLPALTKVGD